MNNSSGQRSYGVSDPMKGSEDTSQRSSAAFTSLNGKKAAVLAEIERVNKLPGTSNYAVHRMRVLNKILHLICTQRTALQDDELEQLFAGLSL